MFLQELLYTSYVWCLWTHVHSNTFMCSQTSHIATCDPDFAVVWRFLYLQISIASNIYWCTWWEPWPYLHKTAQAWLPWRRHVWPQKDVHKCGNLQQWIGSWQLVLSQQWIAIWGWLTTHVIERSTHVLLYCPSSSLICFSLQNLHSKHRVWHAVTHICSSARTGRTELESATWGRESAWQAEHTTAA